MSLRFVIARFQHETNTFSPITTPLESFYPQWGADALTNQTGARTAMAAFIDAAKSIGASIQTPVTAYANPSATVDAIAYQSVCDAICLAVAAGCDAILLDLHGAMVASGTDDGEGSLLERIRKITPHIPIGVALDLHANLTPRMIANCDVMLSFKTYPHIDMYETGEQVAHLVLAMLKKEIKPYMTYRQLPILSHTLRSNTNEGAMQQVVKQALAIENKKGILGTSILAGFSLADFYDAGMSVIVISDERHPNAKMIAEKYAEQLAQQIMDLADDFIYTSAPSQNSIDDAIHLQQKSGSGPVLLLDHSDNVMSGGTCDTTDILELALATGLNNLAAGPIADPITVNQLLKIGLEKKCTIALGNRSGWTYQGKPKKPLILEGVVKTIHSGDILVSGPIFTGSILRMGPSVLFETQQAQIVISSERVEPYDLGVMLELGIEIENKSFVLLKSRMYCRPVFTPLCKGLIECDSDQGGPTSSNYARFNFQKVRRPLFPLDALPG